ncbi:MAG: TlpA disulfide reductase family protein [Bacteroidota bacterium]
MLTISLLFTSCFGQGNKEYARINHKIEELKKNRTALINERKALPFKLVSNMGDSISLENYKGKYLLLYFWASWCPTCTKINKRLIPIYDEMKPLGLEILGISLDRKEASWKKALTKRKYGWSQVRDFKGIDSDLATNYGVQYVPNLVLVDPTGRIVQIYNESSIDKLKDDLPELVGQAKDE